MKRRAAIKSGAEPAAALIAAAVLLAAAAGGLSAASGETFAPPADPGVGGLSAMARGGRLDLNRATAFELDLVPGVGLGSARKVVAARSAAGRFASVEDALDRAGLHGPSAAALWRWTGVKP